MSKSESQVQKEIVNWLTLQSAYVVKIVRGNARGIPDLLVCLDGRFYGIEVKREDDGRLCGVVSPLQQHNIEMIKHSGGKAFVARSLDDVKKELEYEEND